MSESHSLSESCAPARLSMFDRAARGLLVSALNRIKVGRLVLRDNGETFTFGVPVDGGSPITIVVHDPALYRRVLIGGLNGAADGYVNGLWSCDRLTSLISLFLHNEDVMNGLDAGLARLAVWADRIRHGLARNTPGGSRRNIAAHYDMGNDFFAAFLDDSMMYSCALFDHPGASLAEAQEAKLERICQRLALSARDHVIEIGTGWGGFALHAATRYGCRVTTTTISRRQYEFARQRVCNAGVSNRVTVLSDDYRSLSGQFDKLVSIEMIEAVGHRYYPEFFRTCGRLLKPNGSALIQAITIPDQLYGQHLRTSDVIKRFVFPGSNIPSLGALTNASAASDLRLVHAEDFGLHYAETLRRWRHNLAMSAARLRSAGYADDLLRLWEFYFCYCEAGFDARYIGLSQLCWAKPGVDPAPFGAGRCEH